MQASEVQAKVKKVIARVLHVAEDSISDNANFVFDLGADSAQSLELVAGFQEEFEIKMDEDKALAIQTVADAVRFIEGYVK